jgi:hypothetical protein
MAGARETQDQEKKMAQRDEFPILPSTHIGELLERYPELEELLIGMAPAFKKLKNPFLRKSVGKVASLRQAAAVGAVPVNDLVNKLRNAVGQEPLVSQEETENASYFGEQPEWYAEEKIALSIDESSADPNKMPINAVLVKMQGMQSGEMLELITDFLPAPGIDIMRKKGFQVWTIRRGPERICTYVLK